MTERPGPAAPATVPDRIATTLAAVKSEGYTPAMVDDATGPEGDDPVGDHLERDDFDGGGPGPRLPRPSRARFPGWLLPLLGGVAGGFVAAWWGAAFGGVVGFLVWRTRT